MAKKDINESEQQEQGITLGTQGNQDMTIPGSATHGSHRSKEGKDDRHIPNQERSSASSQEKARERGEQQ